MARLVQLHSPGMRRLLTSEGVHQMVQQHAAGTVASCTDPGHPSGPAEFVNRSKVGPTRAIAWVTMVHPLGAMLEARYRVLLNAVRRGLWTQST